jgi:class 3 adenylate cyclase
MNRFPDQVADLLRAARDARSSGDAAAVRALATAVLALEPGHAEAEGMLIGAARRRQMTLLFCDVVGSTAIADSRDPEETSLLLHRYRRICAEVVARHRGFVQDHLGDGMLVLFGYPDVGEDDVRRAVRCGLDIIRSLTAATGADRLHVRVAVHTDLVVLDGSGIAGPTSNEAARIQAVAGPDTVVISDTTEAIVRDWFDVRSQGRVRLRGIEREIEIFTVLRERVFAARATGSAPSPFTGRRTPLERIGEAWSRARDGWLHRGSGSVTRGLLVTGLAGVGKTRLLQEAAERLGAPRADCHCSRYQTASSLHPLRRVLERSCDIEPDDPGPVRVAKMRDRLARDGVQAGELPFLAAAMSVPVPTSAAPAEVDAQMLRSVALHVASNLVASLAEPEPAMVIVDDLQWADRSTLDLLLTLFTVGRPGLLVLLAARDGFVPPWPASLVPTLHLDPLSSAELGELAEHLLDGSPLSDAQRAEVIDRSDGMPLFLEELVRTAESLERNQAIHRSIRFADYPVPPALRDPLLARLTSPGVDIDLAQIAATIGRDVERSLLGRVADRDGADLDGALGSLVAADVVELVGADAVRFRHELIREVAYETQPHGARRARHSRIADHLLADALLAGRTDAGPITFHLERAGRHEEAIGIAVRAARTHQELGAHGDATRLLTQALQIVERLPDGPDRDTAERSVRELRSFSAVMSDGYAAPEAAADHHRCVELCERAGLSEELLPGLIRSWSYFAFRGDLAAADRVTERIEAVGAGEAHTLVGVAFRGTTAFFRGRFAEARRLMQAFVDHPWGAVAGEPPGGWPLPHDPWVAVSALLAPNLWILGEESSAEVAAGAARARAATLPFPFGAFSTGYAASLAALTHRLAGAHETADALADEMVGLGARHGFALWGLAGGIQRGIGHARSGAPEALEGLVQNVTIWRTALVADLWTPYWLTELARAHHRAGELAAARAALDDALGVAESCGVAFYTAVTLRLRGEIRCAEGDPTGASDIERAVRLAVTQGADRFAAQAREALSRVTVR